mgnify:CR=1 FL=1
MTSECYICLEDRDSFEVLPCHHRLCTACYYKLCKTQCPFCRNSFIKKYNKPKKVEHNATSIYIPDSINESIINQQVIGTNAPYSRAFRNMRRKRRRNLSFEEVLLRRQMTKKRSRMKWMKKNRRTWKENHHFLRNE